MVFPCNDVHIAILSSAWTAPLSLAVLQLKMVFPMMSTLLFELLLKVVFPLMFTLLLRDAKIPPAELLLKVVLPLI